MIKIKNILSLILVVGLSFSYCNSLYAQDTLQINPNGYNKFYYDDGSISSEGTMRNGKPDGYWKNYYSDSILKSEGNRKEYLLDSLWKFYDER